MKTAWRIAAELGRPDTFDAEYVALTTLQADALVTRDATVTAAARHLVEIRTIDVLR